MSSSATASSITRSASHRSSNQHPPSSDNGQRPHRSQSTAVRTGAPPNSPHRSQSQSQAQSHRPGSSQQQQPLANVARRDFEQSNLAQAPSARRSGSRDRAPPNPNPQYPVRTDSMRANHHRTSSRTERYPSIDAAAQPPTNGVAADPSHSRTVQPSAGRRRTTIETPTGRWGLGKTIGAGSMGKVKLAKNLETGEQVCSTMRHGMKSSCDARLLQIEPYSPLV
jgi:hypothetical protein